MNVWEEQKAYGYWLDSIPGIGKTKIRQLYARGKSASEIYRMEQKALEEILGTKASAQIMTSKENWDINGKYAKMREKQIKIVTTECKEYPDRLRQIPDPPHALYYIGQLPQEKEVVVAVVGSRNCSAYGKYMAQEIGKVFSASGAAVVSGLAYGIDGICQRQVLQEGGRTYAVLGSGVDICYPASNRDIYEKMKSGGGILSEYVPGTKPMPNYFPPRNRIISGLADAVIVIEAREKSGTLITVDMSLEQGKSVYVVPGRVTDPLSQGCNRLLRQGAEIIINLEELAEEIFMSCATERRSVNAQTLNINDPVLPARADLTEEERDVLEILDYYPRQIQEIYEKNDKIKRQGIAGLMTTLLKLELKKLIVREGGYYVRVSE